jgi:hypothetical protein
MLGIGMCGYIIVKELLARVSNAWGFVDLLYGGK